MNVHITTGRWRLGLALSLFTAFLWGIVPIALKGLLDHMDAYTITWYRFLIASVLLFLFVLRKKGMPPVNILRHSLIYLLVIAGLGLSGNYILYILGLDHLSPGTATVVIQLAPIFLLFGSLIIFKERFSPVQWTGFAVLVIGLLLFFNDRLDELLQRMNNYTVGVFLVMSSAAAWAMYAMVQKQLLKTFPSETTMLFVYLVGTVLFFPTAYPARFLHLDGIGIFLLVFCGLNTLLAYGSFAEALDHWEASRVSAVLATIPLITIAGMKVCSSLFPGYISPEQLNTLSIAGACLVVAGSMLCALGRSNTVITDNKV